MQKHHAIIQEGGKLEVFAKAIEHFCREEGWKQLKNPDGKAFRSLRHYIEADRPYGAGYPGRAGMEKIEAYLALDPTAKRTFLTCHSLCLYEMSHQEELTPAVVSRREWGDLWGAGLAREMQSDEGFEDLTDQFAQIMEEYLLRERAVSTTESRTITLKYRKGYPYALIKQLHDKLCDEDFKVFWEEAFNEVSDEDIAFERRFNIAKKAYIKS